MKGHVVMMMLLVGWAAWGDPPVAPLAPAALAQYAEWVVHADVMRVETARDGEGRVFTRADLRVREVWKGPRSVARLRVVHSGWPRSGERRDDAFPQVQLESGEEVVLFVRANGRGEAVCVGMAQGKYCVRREAGLEPTVQRALHGSGTDAGMTLARLRAVVRAGGSE